MEGHYPVGRIDTHTYGGSKRGQLKDLAISEGKNLWMSEVDGNGESGQNAGAMAPGLWLSQRITTDCNDLNASAWILWQVIDKHVCEAGYLGKKDSGMVDMTKGFWGTAVADHDKDTIVFSKKYYCFGQYSRYIRPGMTMLNSSGSTMAAYDKEKGQVVLVAYNTLASPTDLTVDLSQFETVGSAAKVIRTSNTEDWADLGDTAITGSALKTSLAPNSVTTFIVDGVKGGGTLGDQLTPVKVTGTESWKNNADTGYDKAFDGSNSTYFDGLGAGWVQADLGEVCEITGFGYCPRSGYEARCADGMIQVSADGTAWETVYTISGAPGFGMHYVRPDGEAVRGRYVRYIVPDGKPNNGVNNDDVYCCNIAEIAVFGKPGNLMDLNEIPVDASMVTGSEAWKNSVNDAKKAFDGDNSTFFDGVGEGWVQANLGAPCMIQAIGFCPRSGHEIRCEDGIFEVSMDGKNWKTVHTVKGVPSFGMQYITGIDEQAQYVRYRVPEGAPKNSANKDSVYCCNIAEIKIYGSESMHVTVPAGDANGDGGITVADAVTLQKYLTGDGKLANPDSADMNRDGIITAVDLTLLKRMLMK